MMSEGKPENVQAYINIIFFSTEVPNGGGGTALVRGNVPLSLPRAHAAPPPPPSYANGRNKETPKVVRNNI